MDTHDESPRHAASAAIRDVYVPSCRELGQYLSETRAQSSSTQHAVPLPAKVASASIEFGMPTSVPLQAFDVS